ncbi:hypothetical protein PSHT_06768 [Puccinia striiformis]|uniref:RxLR effector protein n=1 Tax=Puccinia striiformis TaxID=27350 RepID=A0A2S4W3W6_9BASI|nr:hypothetical protein PSHT_06768 [Puccinia striiformis]
MLSTNRYTLAIVTFCTLFQSALTVPHPIQTAPAADGRPSTTETSSTAASKGLIIKRQNGRPRPKPVSVTPSRTGTQTTGTRLAAKPATATGNKAVLKEAARTLNTEADQVTSGLKGLKTLNPSKVQAEIQRLSKIVADEAAPRDIIGRGLPNNRAVQNDIAKIKSGGKALSAAVNGLKTTPPANLATEVDKVLRLRQPILDAVKRLIAAAQAA